MDTREELHFIASIFSIDTPFNADTEIIWVYLQDGDDWMWDENKDNFVETLKRYPLDKFKWVSIKEND